MPLKLVLGPANSAKAGEVLGAFGALAKRGAVLVVPTGTDALHYRRELADQGVVLGSVVTFTGLAGEIARRARYGGRRLSARQRSEVLRRALSSTRFEVLGSAARSAGFREAAGALIAELQRGLITPSRLGSALRSWAAEDERMNAYAGDLERLYHEYIGQLEQEGRVDEELFAWRSLDALRAAPDRWGRDSAFFYGFDDLTALERDAVETLARFTGAEVTVSLTYEPERVALTGRAETVAELRPLADELVELPARDDYYAPGSRRALHHLERSLFQAHAAKLDPGPAVGLLEAGSERSEAELVAAEVLELLRTGTPGEEIAIVFRSVKNTAPLVAAVFAQYGIPLAASHELPFVHTPLGRALRGAARCALIGGAEARADDLLAYLRAPGLLERPELADVLEAGLRRDGVLSASAARERLGRSLPELDALAAASDPAGELCRLGRLIFAAPHRGGAPVLSSEETVDARALSALVAACEELSELGWFPSRPELLELLEELTVPAGQATQAGRVLLAEPLQIRARRFRAVFICGLQEGAFPSPGRPEPFLSDERRREVALASGLRLRPHEDVLDRERYLFYATVSRATERVVFSYRSSDEEGNLLLGSPFLSDVAEVLAGHWPQRRRRRLLADVVWESATAPTPRELAKALAAENAPPAGEQPETERSLGQVALDRLRHTEILSAGALESYAECPVKWLIERELRPQRLEPEPEPVARGNLMHAVLERLLGELGGPPGPEALAEAERLVDSLLRELAPRQGAKLGAGAPKVVRAGLLRAIEADLRRYLTHAAASESGWRSFALEARFGFEPGTEGDSRESLPALALGSEPNRVLIRGMIDRIDVDAAGRAIVRDYKSGAPRSDFPAARWGVDQRLQVALYLVAVRELTELDPVAGFYQPLRGDDLRGRGMFLEDLGFDSGVNPRDGRSPEAFSAELDDAAERAVAVAGALRSGALVPCPQTCSRDGCAYPAICRSQ
jgi:ATP-dependent helicase/DNAse subunit B